MTSYQNNNLRTRLHRSAACIPATVLLAVWAVLAVPVADADTFNIEIDYMVETGAGGHSHRPTQDEIDAVVRMFACRGHTLNIDVDDAIPHYEVMPRDPDNCTTFFSYSDEVASFGNLKATYFDRLGESGWHYCIFGHQYEDGECNPSGSSGLAEIGGDDLIVTLGSFTDEIGTPWDRASTLAHEFGHNLGLTHCGSMYCGGDADDPDWVGPRPLNMPSIMSYFYQLEGVRNNLLCQGLSFDEGALFKELDYSDGTMCTLDESFLDETFGTGMMSADWDCNGSISGTVSQDLNDSSGSWCNGATGLQTLYDYNEWANIQDFTRTRSPEELTDLPLAECITAEEVREYRASRGWCAQPAVTEESCISAKMIYMRPVSFVEVGICQLPFERIQGAHDAATPGSVIFVAPGTYSDQGPAVLDTRLKIFSVGTAIIE